MADVANGNDVGLYVTNQLIGCLTSNDFTSTNQEIDVTCKDNGGARQILAGGNQSELSFEGFFNPAASYGFKDLIELHKNGTSVQIKQILDDELSITCYAKLNKLDWKNPVNAGSTFSGTFTVDGEWEYELNPSGGGGDSDFVVATGFWDDDGFWRDDEDWID